MRGIILRGVGGFYYVRGEADAVYTLRAQAKLRRERIKPLVGDWVEFSPGEGEEEGWVQKILPRRNVLVRPPVANIDRMVIVVAAASPQPDLMMVDKLLLTARRAAIPAMLVVNKCDLDPDGAAEILEQYRLADVEPLAVSARTGQGVDRLRDRLCGRIYAPAGQSGAGKSTLLNALDGLTLETGDISRKIERGKHTTRHCELIPNRSGGAALDTPGFSLLEVELVEPRELQKLYPEFSADWGTCFFSPCYHAREPKCAVRAAVDEGKIDKRRYERYCALLGEMQTRWRDRYG